MTPEDMARTHARAFAGKGRAWSVAEFAELVDSSLVFSVGDAQAFALGRVIAGEAELLTLACSPEKQGQGLGRRSLVTFEEESIQRAADRLFLEVAADNLPAVGLYKSAGYVEVARRASYYARPDGSRSDALVMEKRVTPNAE